MTDSPTKDQFTFDELSLVAQFKAEGIDTRPDTPQVLLRNEVERYLRNNIHSVYPTTPELHYRIKVPGEPNYLTFTALFNLEDALPGGEWEQHTKTPLLPNLDAYPTIKQLHVQHELDISLQVDVDRDSPTTMTVSASGDFGSITEDHAEVVALCKDVHAALQAHAEHLIEKVATQFYTPVHSETVAEWHRKNKTLFTRDGTPVEQLSALQEYIDQHPDVRAGKAIAFAWTVHDLMSPEGPANHYPITEHDASLILKNLKSRYDREHGIYWQLIFAATREFLEVTGRMSVAIGQVAVGREATGGAATTWETIEVRLPLSALENMNELQVAAVFEAAATEQLSLNRQDRRTVVFLKLIDYRTENSSI